MATRSLSSVGSSLLATVGTTADGLTKGVESVTSLLDVAHAKAQSYARQAVADAKVADELITQRALVRGVRSSLELAVELDTLKSDTKYASRFDEVHKRMTEVLAAKPEASE